MYNREQLESFVRSLDQLIDTALDSIKKGKATGNDWLVQQAERSLQFAKRERQYYLDRLNSLEEE
ncbi:hypothetical protein ABEV00_28435 [Paenibacillus thiaminolyticus]|uniref:hypothetical protein n=1 Tax=Paenibacillus thiaminolyticus TaxID=49283 RepID=UPI003D2ABF3B